MNEEKHHLLAHSLISLALLKEIVRSAVCYPHMQHWESSALNTRRGLAYETMHHCGPH